MMSLEKGAYLVYFSTDDDYFDVLGIKGDKKFQAIPAPVFSQILNLGAERFQNQKKIIEFLGPWFNLSVLDRCDIWDQMGDEEIM